MPASPSGRVLAGVASLVLALLALACGLIGSFGPGTIPDRVSEEVPEAVAFSLAFAFVAGMFLAFSLATLIYAVRGRWPAARRLMAIPWGVVLLMGLLDLSAILS